MAFLLGQPKVENEHNSPVLGFIPHLFQLAEPAEAVTWRAVEIPVAASCLAASCLRLRGDARGSGSVGLIRLGLVPPARFC